MAELEALAPQHSYRDYNTVRNRASRTAMASHPGPTAATSYQLYPVNDGCILWSLLTACPTTYNDRVIDEVRDVMAHDPKYKRSKQVHSTKQAGVYHLGEAFDYRREAFDQSPIRPLFEELRQLAMRITGKPYDIVLFKVYQPGESLAKHQDVDGSDMSVACFTFASDPSQLCKLAWCKGSKSYKERFSFIPAACSLWFMSGATNSTYSHRVHPATDPAAGGLRVTVLFRQSRNDGCGPLPVTP